MPKPTKRLNKRPHQRSNGGESSAGDGRNRSGPGQAKVRRSIVDNKIVRVAALLFLPVLFGVFGLIIFPPNFDSSGNDVSNVTKMNKPTRNEPILNREKPARTEKGKRAQEKAQSKTRSRKEKSNLKQEDVKSPPAFENFKETILDSLLIQDITVDGQVISPVELTRDKPESPVKVYMYEGFLTDRECDGLKRVHQRHLTETGAQYPILCFNGLDTLKKHLQDAGKKDVKVSAKDFTKGTTCINASFSEALGSFLTWSHSTSFYPLESKFSSTFEDRVFQATGLKQSNGGKFQITSYPEGIGYKTHTDCTIGNLDKRDRFATILVYLQDVLEGGETKFPELGISVKPRKGLAIVWNNMNSSGECEPISVHEAAQVKKGHKFIIQRWYYYENFPYLGRRSPEPDLPERAPGQPRVNCDEYEHGSCRWYDEWNNDHLTDYRILKLGLV